MSERSSESSCEWVVLNESEEDLFAENVNQSLNEDLSYDALSNVVCDSIRSSLTSEELEWQYEVFDDYSHPQEFSHIEDLDPKEFDIGLAEDSNFRTKEYDDNSSQYSLINEYEKDDCLNVASSPKVHSYKHDRNERLNFVLNLLLALAISSAIGLGTGHFLGWSHKCFKNSFELTKAATGQNAQYLMTIKQNFENKIRELEEKIMISQPASENIPNPTSCSNSKDESISVGPDILTMQPNNNIITNAALELSENSIYMTSDVLELKSEHNNQNFSHSDFPLGFVTDFDWSKISNADVSIETIEPYLNAVLPVVDNDYLFHKDSVSNIGLELSKEFYLDNADIVDDKIDEKLSANVDKLPQKDDADNLQANFFKQFNDKDTFKENNLMNQLKTDLNQVIESITFIAMSRLMDLNVKHITLEPKSEGVLKLYKDFQNLINNRIVDINNFVLLSTEYKVYDKTRGKQLRRMVYSLVDAVDHLMKVSFKALNRRDNRINVYKYSNNIAKVIFNFNKKWEKNKRFSMENMEKFKVRGSVEKPFKRENKYWKKNTPVENSNHKKNKFRRFAMKS